MLGDGKTENQYPIEFSSSPEQPHHFWKNLHFDKESATI
jgi:hypothetical protein